jgi:hypothetical protein
MGKFLIGLILGSLITLFVYRLYQSYPNIRINPGLNLSQSCQSAGGKWLPEFKECEWQSILKTQGQALCGQMGGQYDDCASPCRHQPGYPNITCLTVCAMVCKF